jgi:hypothetical protein
MASEVPPQTLDLQTPEDLAHAAEAQCWLYGACRATPDFRILIWGDEVYHLSPIQAYIVGILCRAYVSGKPDVSLKTLQALTEIKPAQLPEFFGKDEDAAPYATCTWDSLITTRRSGTIRLRDPHNVIPKAAPSPDCWVRFQMAWDALDSKSGGHNFVSLVDLRKALGDYERWIVDGTLKVLRQTLRFSMSALEGRHGSTEEEREAAILEDGQYLLYVSRRTDFSNAERR